MHNEIKISANKIIDLIKQARQNALQNINIELINLYWCVGEYLSKESEESDWGDSFIDETAKYIRENYPEIKGFTRRGLYRMRQFYDTYKDNKFVSPLVTQISWTNHLLILSGTNSCVKEKYSKRELERQIKSGYFERCILSTEKTYPAFIEKDIQSQFLDTYVLEFLALPEKYSEQDLQKSIIHNLRNFILEVGQDFTFVGEEYKLQVGESDFFIDLLFYHRGLSCLVAFELKIDNFKPEYVGKMNFYLEALDREYKKPNENPSIGVILCATKNDEIVEYAMSRSLSPTLVSQYSLNLIDKKLLQEKLREYHSLFPNNTMDN